MGKQIGIVILTDNVADLRGMVNQLEKTFENIQVLGADTEETTNAGDAATAILGTAVNQVAESTENPGVDRDAIPWDVRIHTQAVDPDTNNYKKTGKGVWQKKRGADKQTIAAVERELLSAAPAAIPSNPADQTPPGPASGSVAPGPGAAPIPMVKVLPVPAVIAQATLQDCINITQVYGEIHGADAVQPLMTDWNMTDMSQLPAEYYGQWVQTLVDNDAAAAQ